MSDYNDLCQLKRRPLPTAILRYPSGRFGLVGSMPAELCEPYSSAYGHGMQSRAWDTEQEAIDALLAIGITHFQRADCTWYDAQSNP